MKRISLVVFGVVAVVVGMVASSALFVVDQREQTIVVRLGNPQRVIRDPGLYFKMPVVDSLVTYDKRVLDLDPSPEQVILSDQKRINVDAFARYVIVDPLRFYQAVRNEAVLRDRFGKTMNSSLRSVLGQRSLPDLLSDARDDIMKSITTQVGDAAASFGIKVVDVRIGRTDLPEDISKNVYERMRSEREREANKLRAEGDEIKARVTAEADREKTVIVADAERQAQIALGEGEAAQIKILGDAHGRDPDFFSFIRSLEAYRGALNADDTTWVLSPDSEFFRFLRNQEGKR